MLLLSWLSKDLQFIHPGFLVLLVALPLLGWWHWRRQQKLFVALQLPTLSGISGIRSWRQRLTWLLPTLRLLALGFLILALARPQRTLKEEQIKAEGIDIMLVMDLSSSMLAQDFKPDRLQVSKRVASNFVDQRPYDRLGLVVFSGESFTQCPLTTDQAVVKTFLNGLECGILEDGTAIGMGLATAVNRMKDSPIKTKVIILLTDGVNNAGYVKPITAAEIAREFGIKVYTIGVGTIGDALTPVSRRSDGTYILGLARVEIDEALLQQIASMTGGRYFRATSERSLEEIYAEIDRMEKTEIEVTTIKRYSEEFGWLVVVGLLLLAAEFALRQTLFRSMTD